MKNKDKIVSDFFKANPNAKACHLTSDGEPFVNKSYADLHATTSGKTKLKVETILNTGKPQASKKNDKGGKDTTPKLSEMKAPALKKLAADLGITHKPVISNKALIELIEEKKAASKLGATDLQKLADDLKVDVATLDTPEKIKAAQDELKNK